MVRKEYIEDFLNRLSSASPTPGGGGAGALSGALGCALGRMVANLTAGRKKYASVQDEMRLLDERLSVMQEEFLGLADRDEEVFSGLMEAVKLPKATEEEKEMRAGKIREALAEATRVPLLVMEKASEALKTVIPAAEKGNINAVSDAGAAANLLLSALETGEENVRINLASMKDEEMKETLKERMETILSEGRENALLIRETVRRRVEGA